MARAMNWFDRRNNASSSCAAGRERRLRVECLEQRQLLSVAPAMVADANESPSHANMEAQRLTEVGDSLYFVGTSGGASAGLWRSDGTAETTTLVKSFPYPGHTAQLPYDLANVAGQLFFWTSDASYRTLWTSDGTDAGTVSLKAFARDPSPGPFGYLTPWHELNGAYYFSASDFQTGTELWKSDGTVEGTVQVTDIMPGSSGSFPKPLVNLDGVLYFTADSGSPAAEIWRTDGTTAGLYRVTELPGTSNSLGYATVVGDRLFFAFNDGAHGTELWSSDGSAAGTALVKDMRSPAEDYSGHLAQFVDLNDTLYFTANFGSRSEMWRSDGTAAGTTRVFSDWNPMPRRMINVAGTLYFTRDGAELWKSDGTAAGSSALPLPDASSIGYLYNADGVLYFTAQHGSSLSNVSKLWKSDGSASGPQFVKEITQVSMAIVYQTFATVGESLYFSNEDPADGRMKLWKTEADAGTGVTALNAFDGGTNGSKPDVFEIVGDWMYYIGRSATHMTSLWKTDGIETVLVKNLRPAPIESYTRKPSELLNVDGTLYFTATDGEHGYELWKSDGTAARTVMVKDVNPTHQGILGLPPIKLTNVNGELFFYASAGGGDYSLWKSDGSELGTVKAYIPGSTYDSHVTSFQGKLFFIPRNYLGSSLWSTDGTFAGTTQMTPEHLVVQSDYLPQLQVGGQHVYFLANDGVSGTELWKSDGTATGASLVKDISPGAASSSIADLRYVDGWLYFCIGEYQKQLWRTDGTEAGTTQIASLAGYVGYRLNPDVVEFQGDVYFTASDLTYGNSKVLLFKSDGTGAEPTVVAELSGTYLWQRQLLVVDDTLYLLSHDAVDARIRVVTLDDSAHQPVVEILPASISLQTSYFTAFNSNIYFSANDGVHGDELWRLLGPEPLAGDYSGDGQVDGDDFLAWQLGFGSVATPAGSGADGDGDGAVGAGDLEIWKEYYGDGVAAVATAVTAAVAASEPSAAGALSASSVSDVLDAEAYRVEINNDELLTLAARDRLFAAGDFTRLYAELNEDASFRERWRRRR